MPERRTVQIKAQIAGKTQSNRYAHGASFSKAITKIGNAELVHFNQQMLIHELIRGSLGGGIDYAFISMEARIQ